MWLQANVKVGDGLIPRRLKVEIDSWERQMLRVRCWKWHHSLARSFRRPHQCFFNAFCMCLEGFLEGFLLLFEGFWDAFSRKGIERFPKKQCLYGFRDCMLRLPEK
mgnify:CR=1 FL=1